MSGHRHFHQWKRDSKVPEPLPAETGKRLIESFGDSIGSAAYFFHEILSGNGKRIQLVLSVGDEIRTSWQNFTYRTYVAGYVLDTIQDHIIIITEDNVAVFSHQFHNENLMAHITKFV